MNKKNYKEPIKLNRNGRRQKRSNSVVVGVSKKYMREIEDIADGYGIPRYRLVNAAVKEALKRGFTI